MRRRNVSIKGEKVHLELHGSVEGGSPLNKLSRKMTFSTVCYVFEEGDACF